MAVPEINSVQVQPSFDLSSSIRVLYVDDDIEMGLFFKRFLEKMGSFSVITALGGPDALTQLSLHSCDIVVSDYYMPGMDGISLLKKINESSSPLPFILFTGKGREEVVMEAINNGAAFYLQKGGDPLTLFSELAHKIRQAVGKRQTELALRESEEKFRLLFDSARDGILIIADDRVIDGNHQISAFFRMQPEQIIGKTIDELSPPVQPDGSITEERWRSCSTKVLGGKPAFMVWRHQRADGSTFDAEANLNRVILDGKICIQSVIRDISDRLLAQEELSRRNADLSAANEELIVAEEERRAYLDKLLASQSKLVESEQKFRELTDLLPQVVYECDIQGRITYANRQAFLTFGYPLGDIPENLFVFDLIVPEDRDRAIKNMEQIFLDNGRDSHEYRVYRKDTSIIPVIIYSSPIIRDGVCIGFRGIIIDITEQKHSEELLTRSEEQYRTLVEHIQDGVFIIQDGTFQFVNPAFSSFIGYSVSDLIGRNIVDIIAPENKDMVVQRHRDRVNGVRVPEQYEFSMIHRDGNTKILVNMDVGLTTIQEKPVSIGTIRDITHQRLADDALRESERRLADVIDFLPDATFVIDNQGRVIMWNRAMEHLTRVPAEAMLGKGEYEYALPFYQTRRPILIDLALQSDSKTEEQYSSVTWSDGIVVAEAYAPEMTGDAIYLWASASPLRDSKGTIIGAIESIRDITDRKQAEIELLKAREELEHRVEQRTAELTTVNVALTSEIEERRLAEAAMRESEERYRRLVELSPDAIFVHDGTRINYINPAGIRLFGAVTTSDVVGKGVNDFIHPDFSVRASENQELTKADIFIPLISEQKFIRLDRTVIDVEVSSAPIVYQGSAAILVFVRDITRRKKAEEQLRHYAAEMADKNSELDYLTNQLLDMNLELDKRVKDRTEQVIRLMKQKDEFITQIGHDLKTPLTPLRALLPSLIEDEKNSERRDALSVLLRSVHSIQDQTEKILTIARLSRDDVAIQPEHIQILPIIKESIKNNWLFVQSRHLNVITEIPDDFKLLFSASDAITVFDNVIGNAVKYSLDGGTIRISSCSCDGRICILVSDDGIGLSPKEAEHVFDEFYMADSSRHDRNSSGLGLPIVRRLLRLYRGTIRVHSDGKGKGATFYICFPEESQSL